MSLPTCARTFLLFTTASVFCACAGRDITQDPAPSEPAASATVESPAQSKPPPAQTPACSENDPRDSAVTIEVLPEAGEAVYVTPLSKATKSIRVFAYQMGYGAALDTLTERAKAGVDVRVILDGETQRDVNEKYRVALEAAGAKVVWSNPNFSYMHAKAIVVDDREAVVSTGNYLRSFLLKERNFVAHLSDKQDVEDLAALFDADFESRDPDMSCTRLLVSPINSKDRLLALIASAKTSLEVESMQFADPDIRSAVLARANAGVEVRVLLAAPTWIDANANAGTWMTDRKIAARWLASPSLHVKAIVVDHARAYLGSENLSTTSLTKNREIGIVLSDAPAVATMASTIEGDWAKATPFAPNP